MADFAAGVEALGAEGFEDGGPVCKPGYMGIRRVESRERR